MAARISRAVVLATATACLGIVGSIAASAQSAQWLPGVDILVSVYADVDPVSKQPTPATAVLGFDRDTGRVEILDIPGVCTYPVGPWEPTAGKGAITQIFQVSARTFALYHESGYLRVERLPDVLLCSPLSPPKAGW
jgi:hypothetical protein